MGFAESIDGGFFRSPQQGCEWKQPDLAAVEVVTVRSRKHSGSLASNVGAEWAAERDPEPPHVDHSARPESARQGSRYGPQVASRKSSISVKSCHNITL